MHDGVLDLRGKFEKQRGSRNEPETKCHSFHLRRSTFSIAREMPKLLTCPSFPELRDLVQQKLGRL